MIPIELGFMRHNIQNPKQGQELIDWAISHGVNHFEHCSFYLDWNCENYMYSLLKNYKREDYFICGKLPVYNVVTYRDFKELFEEQLKKVPGNYFDTYILQALDERSFLDILDQNIIDFFLKEKEKGTINRFGLSIQCLPEVFEKYLKLNCWDIVQMPINYYDWFLCRYNENYQLARKYNIPIIAQAPVKGGLLLKDENIPENSFIKYSRSNLEATYDFVSQLEGIELILCGNSRLESFKTTYDALKTPKKILLEDYQEVINTYINNIAKIECINCNRCVRVCPEKIPISGLFKLYNLALKNKTYFNAFDIMKSSFSGEISSHCTHCMNCVNVCPFNNDIPKILRSKIFELRT